MKWILLAFLAGCILASCGCMKSQRIKIVTDITPRGEVTYHTEYVGEF